MLLIQGGESIESVWNFVVVLFDIGTDVCIEGVLSEKLSSVGGSW